MTNKLEKVAIIMAGGVGPRFWPRSKEKSPKQFIHLLGDGTLIQNSFARLMPLFSPEEIFVVTNKNHGETVLDQLPMLPQGNIILEPFGRNTAPCLALAMKIIAPQIDEYTIISAFPADHIINNVREFHISLENAQKVASFSENIVTIGISPTRPETGFGYIQFDENEEDLADFYNDGARCCTAFAEKPDIETALRFIHSGDFLWNSGIFTMTSKTFWNAFRKFLPDHSMQFDFLEEHIGKDDYQETLELVYRQIDHKSMDYAILEKTDNVIVIKSSFNWSDLGTWDELFRLSMKDARNNYLEGEVVSINSTGCYVESNTRIIGLVDVDNLIVVDTEDSLLICKRGKTENTIELVDFLRRKNIKKYI